MEDQTPNQFILSPPPKSRKPLFLILLTLIVLALVGIGIWLYSNRHTTQQTPASQNQTTTTETTTASTEGLQLDPNKNYGNKYADGLLPVGDNKYVTDAAKTGYVYTCQGYSNNLKNDKGGAGSRGPWFTNNNTQYDINKKAHVSGSVKWTSQFSNTLSGSTRLITTNDLPTHTTGTFPIGKSDPAYLYDRNPNSIKSQNLSYSLNATPTYGTPQCLGGEVGVMLTGVAIFNGFDAGGRDAVLPRRARQFTERKINRRVSETVRGVDHGDARPVPLERRPGVAVDLARFDLCRVSRHPRQAVALEAVGFGGDKRPRDALRIPGGSARTRQRSRYKFLGFG